MSNKIHAIPLSIKTVTKENLPIYLKQFKSCGITRVFLCGMGHIELPEDRTEEKLTLVKYVLDYLRNNGIEPCLWFCAFGHGSTLVGATPHTGHDKYTSITGVDGNISEHGFCPLDDNFRRDYYEGLKKYASLSPSIIMFDDDFRMISRPGYKMGCFCEKHKKLFFDRIGENVLMEDIPKLVYTGGKSKYRDAYMAGLADGLYLFAKGAREVVDEVDPTIRMGVCTNQENIDLSGTDMATLCRIFAGKTKPFTRVCGAAYSFIDVTRSIDMSRLFFHYFKDEGIETFSEGDVYPRPRYNFSCSSKQLELMNLALVANGEGNGELNYIFDYYQKPDYETGYIERYIDSIPNRKALSEMFDGKRAIGVRAYNVQHKIQDMVLPKEILPDIETKMMRTANGSSIDYLSKNSIPITFEDGEYPTLIVGANAHYIDLSEIGRGALLDGYAARVLKERGVDTGFISGDYTSSYSEYYVRENDAIPNVDNKAHMAIECDHRAEVLSRFISTDTPSSYRYENAAGQRFYVLATDVCIMEEKKNFINNYYRQKHLMDAVEWIAGKPLPVVSYKNPGLYTLAKRGKDGSMAIFLGNLHFDDILTPTLKLDRSYQDIKFINCDGRLDGDTVYLSKLHGLDFAAFEVK